MGCSGSKADDLPLVVRCRERRELIRAAANHRYALAAAHVSYFRSLKDVGDALRKFVDEEILTASATSSSSVSSPSLILPPGSTKQHDNADESKQHLHDDHDDDEASHLITSDSSSEDEDSAEFKRHYHNHHGHESEDDTHQHRKHRAHADKGKGVNEEARHLHDEEESSSYHPRGGFNGYRQGSGDGLVNDPYMYPYPYAYQPPSRSYGAPFMDQWNPMEMPPPVQPWDYSSNSNFYYMKKSAPVMRTVVQEAPTEPSYGYSDSYWHTPAGYENPGYGGNSGYYTTASPVGMVGNGGAKMNSQKEVPPPPSPKGSSWDFFNPFEVFDNGYPGYYSGGEYGYGSISSSPDSSEVREREGIPDLEEETENEVPKEALNRNRTKTKPKRNSGESTPRSRKAPVHKNREVGNSKSVPLHKIEGTSRSVPLHESESSSQSVPSWCSEEIDKPHMVTQNKRGSSETSMPPRYSEESVKASTSLAHRRGKLSESPIKGMTSSIGLTDKKSSPEDIVLKSVDVGSMKKKGVTFEVEGASKQDGESSILSSVTLLSPHGNRDLREVVAEIRDEFETASSFGKEVAMMLEVGKLPYQPSFLKVLLSRIFYLISPSLSFRDPPSMHYTKVSSKTTKLAKSYFDDAGKDVKERACNLSSTLEKLYAWEKKLYKEVKDEERMRVTYEKQCKRLKILDEEGAESSKIDAVRASIRKLLTKLDVSIKAIDAISSRIHKLRDEELQPQVASLVHGLIRMWKAMLKCHQKQFQAIMESKMRKLKVNTGLHTESRSRATTELERELRIWCTHFNDWIHFQKSYVESLNGWLLQCLQYVPEGSPDGPVPYSPGKLGAPSIFIICNDWLQAMEAISEASVASTMGTFATSLRQLWEKQDEEAHQRLRAEYITKDYEKHLKTRRIEKGKMEGGHDAMSDKTGLSVVAPDDLREELDTVRERLNEERIKHKDALKLVHDAASSSLKGGLVPIFRALENFTSEALKAHEHVRLQHPGTNL